MEGAGGGGGDQPVAIEDGKVDGASVSFRAGTTTYAGTVEREELQLQRSFAGGRGRRIRSRRSACSARRSDCSTGASRGHAPPAVGPPADDLRARGFWGGGWGGGGGGGGSGGGGGRAKPRGESKSFFVLAYDFCLFLGFFFGPTPVRTVSAASGPRGGGKLGSGDEAPGVTRVRAPRGEFVALLLALLALAPAQQAPRIVIDYPEEGSIFPPDFAPPTFLWRDSQAAATAWEIEIAFPDGAPAMRLTARGEPMSIGEIDPRCVAESNQLPKLTPEQAAAHTWKPDAAAWSLIKQRSAGHPATVTITGSGGARGQVRISTSKDPVGAPIFYRDVPLMPSEVEKGVIKPIIPSAVPLVGWRLRNVAESGSRLVMEGLPTCANCHSFSKDGKTLALDVDGPQNDKGTYAIVSLAPRTSIRTEDVFTWNDFPDKPPGHRTIGFMAQISPDGRYAVTTVNEDVFVDNFKDYRFLQVFYPTRGILAWYDRSTRRIRALPGADNPNFVQTNGFWSPDGKYLVFARAGARDAYPEGRKMAEYAGDPLEPAIQYDLYRIPFNGGKGGRPKAIAGASEQPHEQFLPEGFARRPLDRFRAVAQRPVDAPRRPALHRAVGRRPGPAHAMQHGADELLAQFLAQRALAGVLLQEPLAVHADVPDAHRRGGQRQPRHPDRELHGRQSRGQHPGIRQHSAGWAGAHRCARRPSSTGFSTAPGTWPRRAASTNPSPSGSWR